MPSGVHCGPGRLCGKVFVLNFGWTMAGEFLFCFFVGYYADQKLGSGYVWTLTGMGAGVLLIVYELWKILRR